MLQAVSDFDMERGAERFDGEFDVMERFGAAAKGHTLWISWMQRDLIPTQWQDIRRRAEAANQKGIQIRLQALAGQSGLAVSFVGGNNDARLVGDIEKLIKTKIELEAVEYDEDAPDIRKQGRINDGRRMYSQDGEGTGGGDNGRSGGRGGSRGSRDESSSSRAPRAPRNDYARPPQGSRDPFFDKPYEPTAISEATAPSWEATARPASRWVARATRASMPGGMSLRIEDGTGTAALTCW